MAYHPLRLAQGYWAWLKSLLAGDADPDELLAAVEEWTPFRRYLEDAALQDREAALALAQEVAANAPTSLALTKELLNALPGMGLEDGFRLASIANAWVRETGDLAEGIAAFFEKRPPRF